MRRSHKVSKRDPLPALLVESQGEIHSDSCRSYKSQIVEDDQTSLEVVEDNEGIAKQARKQGSTCRNRNQRIPVEAESGLNNPDLAKALKISKMKKITARNKRRQLCRQ